MVRPSRASKNILSEKTKTRESRGQGLREVLEPKMDGWNKKTKGFFKVFNPESSSQKMKIPPAFTNYMGDNLPREVFLRDRYKNLWPLKVEKTGNDLFFEEGWVKFIKDNCVEVGDFFIFDYIDTKSLFDFKLFGRTCCEKIGVGRPNFLVKEEVEWKKSDSSEEEEEECDQSNELDFTNIGMSEDEYENKEGEEWEQSDKLEDEDKHPKEEEEDSDGEGRKAGPRVHVGNHPKQKAFDYYGTNIFKSGIYPQPVNPYFVAKFQKGRSNELHIPEHVRRDFNLKLPPKMILRDPRGKDWEAKVKTWKDGRVVLTGGWSQLCKWNLIQVEDNCICEFVSEDRGMGRMELLLQIHVVRAPRA